MNKNNNLNNAIKCLSRYDKGYDDSSKEDLQEGQAWAIMALVIELQKLNNLLEPIGTYFANRF